MATLTGHLVADTYKALLKMIDNDILTAAEKQISDGLGGGTNVFIDQNGFLRANKYKVTGATSSQFLKGDGSLDSTAYLPVGTTTTNIPEGTNLYFTTNRVLNTLLTGFSPVSGTVEATDSILTAINKIWWNIENGGGGGGGYVPYTGATQNLNLGTYGLISDYVQFNTTNSSIPTTAGTMSWNDTDGTADLKLKGGNVTLQIGQEEVLRVVNKTGATLAEADFRAVRIRSVAEGGAQGQRLAVVLAQGDNDPDSATTIGIVTETIANNQEGFITTSGEVKKIDTTGAKSYGGLETWVDGDVLYLSPTHPGYLTKVKPQAPDHTIIVGWVVYAHANNGKIFVKVDNGYELDELHNVKITNPQDDDFLMYDSVESVWINKDLHGTLGYLPYYYDTKVFEQSPIFTDGSQVIIGSDTEFATGNKLSVVGNLAVDSNYGYHLGTYQILFRYNATGELRFGTNAANDFTTFFANGIERMRLNASGYLGIGLTSPTQPLHVKGVLAYPKIIIDNNSTSGGGAFSAYQNGTETANFGISGAWLLDSSSDVAIVATRAGKGIQFYTNGSTSEKMGINSDGNVFIGQTPTYVAGATQLIVRGKTGAGYLGVNHYDMSIKGSINTFNSVFQVGTSTFHAVAILVEDIERARFNSSGRMLLGTTTDNMVDMLQVDGSIIGSAIKKSGGTSSQYLMADGSVSTGPSLAGYVPTSRTLTINGTGYDLSADRSWSVGTVTSVDASVPTGFAISGSPITSSGTLAITFASGYSLPTTIKQSNWDDAYTWVSGFPSQTGNAGKFLTTDGSSLSWSNVVLGVTSFNTRTGAITLLSADVTGALGYTPVPTTRTLSINGTSYDLSADRSWTISAGSNSRNVSTFTATAGQTTFTITGGYTPNLVDVYVNGARLNANDYVATSGTSVVLNIGVVVNDIVEVVNYVASSVASITGTGTSGYIAKWSGTSAIANSLIYDNGSHVAIGTTTPDTYTQFGTGGGFTLQTSTTNGSSNINVVGNGSGFGGINFGNGTIRRAGIYGLDGSALGFYTNSTNSGSGLTERMRITSAGNVGIGTSSPTIYGGGLEVSRASQAGIRLSSTGGVNPGGIELGYESSVGGFIQTVQSGGQISFYTGNAAVMAMRITSGGNIGIGTTSPTNGYKLDVLGSILSQVSSGNTSIVVQTNDANGAINAITGFGLELATDSTNQGIRFRTGATEKMRITSGGDVGIGTTAPATRLHLNTSGDTVIRLTSTAGAYSTGIQMYAAGAGAGFIYSNQSIYVTANANGVYLPTNGTSWVANSDLNLKNIESYIENAIDSIMDLKAIRFNWKADSVKSTNIGLIAQEVEKVYPELIDRNTEGHLGVRYTELIPIIIKAIQELNAKLEAK